MNFWRRGMGLECMLFIARSLELRALPYALNRPPRAAASFNPALHRMRLRRIGELFVSPMMTAALKCSIPTGFYAVLAYVLMLPFSLLLAAAVWANKVSGV